MEQTIKMNANTINAIHTKTDEEVLKIYHFAVSAWEKQANMLVVKREIENCKSIDRLEQLNQKLNGLVDDYNNFLDEYKGKEWYEKNTFDYAVNDIIKTMQIAVDASSFTLVEEA